MASSPSDWAVGEKATLIYQINDPENQMVRTYFSAFGWAVISMVIAIGLLIINGGYYLFTYYSKQFILTV